MSQRHQDWTAPGFCLEPIAPRVGPFAGAEFLETLFRHAGGDEELWIAESDDALMVFSYDGARLGLAGDADLVDYRSPLGSGAAGLVADVVSALPPGTDIRWDSLPVEAVEPLVKGLAEVGISAEPYRHSMAAVLELPASFDEYLAAIGKKERHELRRKRRRFEAELGPPQLTSADDEGLFASFVELHRSSAGPKGSFMTDAMEEYFAALLVLPNWALHALTTGEGAVAAIAFGYVDDGGYYLYNSAFDPRLREASPGAVMLGLLIEQAIDQGHRIFDFLKGDEGYKFKLGSAERPLFAVEASS